MSKKSCNFDVFSALDGPCLNGIVGEAGVLRMRFYSDGSTLDWDEPFIKYFPGASGGHAVQIAPEGDFGFLGGWSDTGRIFDPRTLEWIADYNAINMINGPRDVEFRSPTHMVFPKDKGVWTPGFAERSGITACGEHFWEVDLHDPIHVQRLVPHELGLPHALKISATGKYIFCGAADFKPGQRNRRVGIFEPARHARERQDISHGTVKALHLHKTSWHIQTHPTKDIMYAVSQNYEPGKRDHYAQWGGNEISIPAEDNYLWEIFPQGHPDRPNDETTNEKPFIRPYGMSVNRASNLSSDLVITENDDGSVNVLYNSCASSTITMIRLDPISKGFRSFPKYIEEAVWMLHGLHKAILRPGVLPSFWRNFMEALWHGDLLNSDSHLLHRVRFVTRKSLVDGSYGLLLSPDEKWLISAHRGLNEFLVYKYPNVLSEGEKSFAYRVKLPRAQNCLPGYCGFHKDRRIGLHHCVVSTTTVEQNP